MSICLYNGTLLSGFAVMERCAVLIEEGQIADVFSQKRFEQKKFSPSTKVYDVEGAYIAPGFIDTHIHGFKGHGTEDGSTEAMLAMSKDLADYGVTSFNPTLYSSVEENFMKDIKAVTDAMGQEQGANIMGMHLEGPFVSPDKVGVQKPETIHKVDLELMERLWNASEGKIVNMTVAPEIKGMRELALFCLKKGIVLQAGHTNATYENMVEGMQAGILHSTHLFNAMNGIDHRRPGLAIVPFLRHYQDATYELIADTVHVNQLTMEFLIRSLGTERLCLISDAMAAAGMGPGESIYLGRQVVCDGRVSRYKEGNILIGSAMLIHDTGRQLVEAGLLDVADFFRIASVNPARVLGLTDRGAVEVGHRADLVLLDKELKVQAVFVGRKD